MKNMGKKHGTTFIEIILALSIIGIISLAVFNNIFFSIKVNTLADKKQKNSIIGQMVYEEIRNLSDVKFKEMLYSIKDKEIFEILGDDFKDITNENINKKLMEEINKKIKNEDTGYFKMYKNDQTDTYVWISFSGLNFTKKNLGLSINNDNNESNEDTYSDWIKESECDVSFIIENDNDYKVTIKRKGVELDKVFHNLEASDVKGKILYEGNSIKIENIGDSSLQQTASGKNAHIYINNETNETFNFTLNNKYDGFMKIYLDQEIGEEKGKIELKSYGDKIQIFSNDSNVNPYGENVKTSNVCKYKVCIFNEKDGTVENMSQIVGYKKFKRFGE